ncbi:MULTISPECIES: DNA polymerase III subunit chi [unclassified Luteimonas]|uniref:DNA polymerase III subunit chi n=1 Tax=Lysobacteraceae TaxID=32033 RepID=UPI00100BE402|nr:MULTISPECIES: DNA polymerase III subunit chi [unclassified Luteimonas]MCD9045472.1 DNA polymerase III subunit chi [Luteimonas sp. MHLX1A]
MPRADFYLIARPRFRDDPLRLVAELARKAYDSGQWTLVLARDQAQAEAIDDQLWDMGDDVFIPHQIAGDEEDDECPVLIATPEFDPPLRALVINLRDAAVPDGFERVLEVVPADPAAREPLRERWKQYRARGIEPAKHDM